MLKLKGGYAFKSEKFQDSGVPVVRISNLPQNSYSVDLSDCVYYECGNYQNYTVKNGDLLIAMSGATTGKTAIYRYDYPAYLNQRVGLFAPKELVHNQFLYPIVESKTFISQLGSKLVAGAQPNISSQDIETIAVGLPSKEEQIKIAHLFELLNQKIETQSKIIEEQETLLKSLADKLFLQNNHSCQLSELVNIEKGKQLNADTLSETGDYYVMNGGITPSGYYSEYNVPAGAISISEGGNSCGYVQFNEKPFWSGGHCYSLQPKTTLVDYKYIYYYLKAKQADVMALRIGSGLPNIQKKDIEKFSISYPSLQSQKRIVKALDALSGKIYTEKHLLEKYCQQKSYLLSQMFI